MLVTDRSGVYSEVVMLIEYLCRTSLRRFMALFTTTGTNGHILVVQESSSVSRKSICDIQDM